MSSIIYIIIFILDLLSGGVAHNILYSASKLRIKTKGPSKLNPYAKTDIILQSPGGPKTLPVLLQTGRRRGEAMESFGFSGGFPKPPERVRAAPGRVWGSAPTAGQSAGASCSSQMRVAK